MQQQPILGTTERGWEALGIRKTKLFELIAQNEIETVLLGRRRMIVWASLEAYVDRLREQTRSEAA